MSFWGDETKKIQFEEGDIILITSAIIKDYQGKSLSCIRSTKITKDIPEIDEYKDLMAWQKKDGKVENLKVLTET